MTGIPTVAVYGDGQLGSAVARVLGDRRQASVRGPFGRVDREKALLSGADLVVIATTTRLADVVDDVRAAVGAGSNVIVSAEEAAFPWAVDSAAAEAIDALARSRDVTVVGGGVNPGLVFDALVVTLLGTQLSCGQLQIRRVVDIGRFGAAVLSRIGVGLTEDEFRSGVAQGLVLGHAGFPQSMAIVADACGLEIERIERELHPVLAERDYPEAAVPVARGMSAGVRQTYTAWVRGAPWYTAYFEGHICPGDVGLVTGDEIVLGSPETGLRCRIDPGVPAQGGSVAMISNSLGRVLAAEPGWRTVAELWPAYPAGQSASSRRRPQDRSEDRTRWESRVDD